MRRHVVELPCFKIVRKLEGSSSLSLRHTSLDDQLATLVCHEISLNQPFSHYILSESLPVARQSSIPTYLVVHNSLRVSFLFRLLAFSSSIRIVDWVPLYPFEFGYPLPNIFSVCVELLALEQGIEDSEVWLRIHSRGSTETPTAVIGGKISINEVFHEISLSHSPVKEEVLCEERSNNHSTPIVHVATVVELSHRSIDYGIPCLSFTPSLEVFIVILPVNIGVLQLKRFVHTTVLSSI